MTTTTRALTTPDEVAVVLTEYLAGRGGSAPATEVTEATIKRLGYLTRKQIDWARKRVGITTHRVSQPGNTGAGHWVWRLPPAPAPALDLSEYNYGDAVTLDGVAALVRRGLEPDEAVQVLTRAMRHCNAITDELEASGRVWGPATSGDLLMRLLSDSLTVETADLRLAMGLTELARVMAGEIAAMRIAS